MQSLPIQEKADFEHHITSYDRILAVSLRAEGVTLGKLGKDLARIEPRTLAHLDPDLDFDSLEQRKSEWRPAFGQSKAAEGHLQRQNVGTSDIFLFYGWFRKVNKIGNKYCYCP